MPSVSFDRFAARYDRTRAVDPATLERALRSLARRSLPSRGGTALELGVGTGRLAIPFARLGPPVVGVDLSERMLGCQKLRRAGLPPGRLEAVRADAHHLPFHDGRFHLVYWCHFLHLVHDWRRVLREAVRVARPGGTLADVYTGAAGEIPELFREYVRLAARRGYRRRLPGTRRREDVRSYLVRLGCRPGPPVRVWAWEAQVSLSTALQDIERRAFAAAAFTPATVHRRIVRELRRWAVERFGPLSTRVRVPHRIGMGLVHAPESS